MSDPTDDPNWAGSQNPGGDTGATAGKEVVTVEQVKAQVESGDFLLDPEKLGTIYGKYHESLEALKGAQRQVEAMPPIESMPNPGLAIKGIAAMQQRCGVEAEALKFRLTDVGNDLTRLLDGLAETAQRTYLADAGSADATKAAGSDS